MATVTAGLSYCGRRRINAVECCQVCKVPIVSEVLQCHAVQQAGQMHNGLCKPTSPTPGLVMRAYVRGQGASIHHQGLLVSKICRLMSGGTVPAIITKANAVTGMLCYTLIQNIAA